MRDPSAMHAPTRECVALFNLIPENPMNIYRVSLWLGLCLLLPQFARAQKLVVGYYPSWFKETLPARNVRYDYLTHINHAFAWPDAAGHIIVDGNFLYPELNQRAHEHGVKISISLGGAARSGGFAPMAADSAARAFFIDNLVAFLKNNHYDGADFDWEFPQSAADRANLTTLIKAVRARFDRENPEWLITMAVGTSNWSGRWHDYAQLMQYVDWFNAMCYDYHGSWSGHSGHNAPLFQPPGDSDGAVNTGMAYLHITRGIPKNQLTVGMPFYGKEFNSTGLYRPFTGSVPDFYYYQIVPKMDSGWTYHWDQVAQVPYLTNSSNTKLITFDDTLSLRLKCEWIKDQDYLGGMIWALGQDVYQNEQPLLETIARSLLGSPPTAIAGEPALPRNYIVHQNYPNPFNPSTTIAFVLPYQAEVRLDIYNAAGEFVQNLLDGSQGTGGHRIRFNAAGLASGIYFYRLQIIGKARQGAAFSGKMLLVR